MAVVKEIEVRIDGLLMKLKISVNTKGDFYCKDMPLNVTSILKDEVYLHKTLDECIQKINSMAKKYAESIRTEERVILVRHDSHLPPSLNEGLSIDFHYAIADKVTEGELVRYYSVHEDVFNGNKLERLGNLIERGGFSHSKGVNINSTQLPYTEQTHAVLKDLEIRLKELSKKLKLICANSEGIESLVAGTLKMLE